MRSLSAVVVHNFYIIGKAHNKNVEIDFILNVKADDLLCFLPFSLVQTFHSRQNVISQVNCYLHHKRKEHFLCNFRFIELLVSNTKCCAEMQMLCDFVREHRTIGTSYISRVTSILNNCVRVYQFKYSLLH